MRKARPLELWRYFLIELFGFFFSEVLQDAYIIRHDFHISNIEKIHMILESHVEILGKVRQWNITF